MSLMAMIGDLQLAEHRPQQPRGTGMARKTRSEVKAEIWARYDDLPAGTRMPPVSRLSKEIGAHRRTVQAAIDQLIDEGRFIYRTGTNLIVAGNDFEEAVERSDISQTMEFRLIVEPAAAQNVAHAVAAELIDREHLARFESAYTILCNSFKQRDVRRAVEADRDFHQALFQMVRNKLLRVAVMRVNTWLKLNVEANVDRLFEDAAYRRDTQDQHEAIYLAVLSGRPEVAADAMRRHLEYADAQVLAKTQNNRARGSPG